MSIAATTRTKKTNALSNPTYFKFYTFIANNRFLSFKTADRKFLLYIVDLLLVLFATFFYVKGLNQEGSVSEIIRDDFPWFVSIAVLWSFFSYIFDLYSLEYINNFYSTFRFILIASTLSVANYILIPWFTPPLPFSKSFIILYYVSITSILIVWRYFYVRLFNRPLFLKRVLVIGSGWSSNSLIDVFAHGHIFNYHLGYKIVGIIDQEKKDASYKGIKIINKTHNLSKLAKRLRVDELIVDKSSHKDFHPKFLKQLTNCRINGVSVTSLSDFYENLTGRVLVHNSGEDFYSAFPYNQSNFRKAYLFFSRSLDIVFGIIGMALCMLILPFVYLSNLLFSPGPLFYTQERIGLYGKVFKIIKFRSMFVDAEKDGAAWAQVNDDRVTKPGKILRRARIDELPQVWNVLKGDMSLIGPRPERPVFVEQLKKDIPFYEARHLTKPGITGWAQAIYKYGSNTDDALMKVQYDLYYLKHRSVMLDIKVILKTISVVVRFKGL